MDRVSRFHLLMPFQEGTHQKLLSQEKIQILQARWQLDYIRYSQVSLLTLCYHWQNLSISFLKIAKDH